MKKIVTPLMLAMSLAAAGSAFAQAAAPAEPESSLSFNAGAVNEYRYRGISQSRLQPALQGGADYADKSGFYVGAWGSSIKWVKDFGIVTANADYEEKDPDPLHLEPGDEIITTPWTMARSGIGRSEWPTAG